MTRHTMSLALPEAMRSLIEEGLASGPAKARSATDRDELLALALGARPQPG